MPAGHLTQTHARLSEMHRAIDEWETAMWNAIRDAQRIASLNGPVFQAFDRLECSLSQTVPAIEAATEERAKRKSADADGRG